MSRPLLPSDRVSDAAASSIAKLHEDTVLEVREAIDKHPVVVVGMAQNPHVKKVRKALEAAAIDFHYLEYGSYLSEWRRRLAIKLWSGWPTFPQVFVRGVLVGGEALTKAALADGSLRARIDAEARAAS